LTIVLRHSSSLDQVRWSEADALCEESAPTVYDHVPLRDDGLIGGSECLSDRRVVMIIMTGQPVPSILNGNERPHNAFTVSKDTCRHFPLGSIVALLGGNGRGNTTCLSVREEQRLSVTFWRIFLMDFLSLDGVGLLKECELDHAGGCQYGGVPLPKQWLEQLAL
jgi:hypothetical protein